MASNIKANGQGICPMGLEGKFGSKGTLKPLIKAVFSMVISMAMPNILILISFIREDSKIIEFLGQARLYIKMDKYMRVNLLMERKMATGYILGLTDLNFKVNIKITKKTVTGNSLIPITKYLMVSG
jgi:hypothetical protein